MSFLKNLFRRNAKSSEPEVALAEGVARTSNTQYDLCVSRAVALVTAAEVLAEAGNIDAYYTLLRGEGEHRVESAPGAGHNHSAVLAAMHAYQRSHPEADMAARFTQALEQNNLRMTSRDAAELSFRYIGLQLKQEANAHQAFSCNNQQLFYDLMTAIAHNREDVEDDMPYFADWLEDRKAFIREYL